MISAVFFFFFPPLFLLRKKIEGELCTIASSCLFSLLVRIVVVVVVAKGGEGQRLTRGRKAVGLLDVAGDDGREREREKSLAFSRSKIRDAKECEHLHAGFEMRISD